MTPRPLALILLVALTSAAGAQAPAPTVQPLTVIPGAAAALPMGNADDGKDVFKKCAACHQIGPTAKNNVGPVLNGVVGRHAGTYPGYSYSDANKNSGITWTPDALASYLPNPKQFMPGTKMTFAGLMNPQDLANVIAYLETFDASGNPAKPQ